MLLDKNFVNHSVVTGVREITECPARACTFNPKFFRDTDNAIFQSEEVLVGDPEAVDSDDNLEDEDDEEYSTPPTSRLSPSSAFSSPSSTETFASSSPCDNDDLSTLASTSSVSRYSNSVHVSFYAWSYVLVPFPISLHCLYGHDVEVDLNAISGFVVLSD